MCCIDVRRTIFEFYSLVPVELRALQLYFAARTSVGTLPISMEISVAWGDRHVAQADPIWIRCLAELPLRLKMFASIDPAAIFWARHSSATNTNPARTWVRSSADRPSNSAIAFSCHLALHWWPNGTIYFGAHLLSLSRVVDYLWHSIDAPVHPNSSHLGPYCRRLLRFPNCRFSTPNICLRKIKLKMWK